MNRISCYFAEMSVTIEVPTSGHLTAFVYSSRLNLQIDLRCVHTLNDTTSLFALAGLPNQNNGPDLAIRSEVNEDVN